MRVKNVGFYEAWWGEIATTDGHTLELKPGEEADIEPFEGDLPVGLEEVKAAAPPAAPAAS